MAALAQHGEAGVDVGGGRVGLDLGEDGGLEAGLGHRLQRPGGDVERGDARVGDEQRAGDAGGAAGVAELGDAARAEADGGGEIPVGGQGHDHIFRRW